MRSGPVLAVLSQADIAAVAVAEAGADDWIAAPVRVWELVARASRLQRRGREWPQQVRIGSDEPMAAETLRLDRRGRRLYVGSAEVRLTATEFRLMSMLMAAGTQPVSRHDLMVGVWGSDEGISAHTLEVHVGNLRTKMREVAPRPVIETVLGEGYRLTGSHRT